MNEINDIIKLRPIDPTDLNFILSTWLKGLYYGNSWFREIDKDTFMANYELLLKNLIDHSTTTTACLIEDPSVIIGYATFNPKTLHWIYVKSAWRKLGVAKKLLLNQSFSEISHLTDIGLLLKPESMKFNPFF